MGRKHGKKNNGIKKVNYDDFSFEEEETYLKSQALRLKPFQPRTQSQGLAYDKIKSNTLTILEGDAGTGKTVLLVRVALEYLEKGLIKKIIITRPAIEVGKSLGFMPGGLEEKMSHFLAPIYDNLEAFIPQERIKQLLEEKVIQIVAVGHMRGRNFHNAFIIVDEAQNLTKEEGYMVLTRIGFDSFMGMTVDQNQIDLKHKDESFVWDMDRLEGGKNIGFFEFGPEDVVRSDMVREIVRLYKASE